MQHCYPSSPTTFRTKLGIKKKRFFRVIADKISSFSVCAIRREASFPTLIFFWNVEKFRSWFVSSASSLAPFMENSKLAQLVTLAGFICFRMTRDDCGTCAIPSLAQLLRSAPVSQGHKGSGTGGLSSAQFTKFFCGVSRISGQKIRQRVALFISQLSANTEDLSQASGFALSRLR